MWTKKEILKSCDEIESLIGMDMIHVRELSKKSSVKDFNIAWNKDRLWLKMLCDDILNRI